MLLNEHIQLERDGEILWIAGIDDPHYYQTHDLKRAREGIPANGAIILLAHAPECYPDAADFGYSTMLSGHTHGGQICLPGGFAIVNNGRVSRRFLRGSWRHEGLNGYTSVGSGGCGVEARFFCPPEVTLHTLVRASS
jgi:hypothetical protein